MKAIVSAEKISKKRILSGVQPTGADLHLGNYFGAIKQHIELQKNNEAYYFIANYHALTTVKDAEHLRKRTLDVAATYLAFGLDPNQAVLYRQSDIPEVCELQWLLASVTGMGLLERAHSYKDKISKGLKASVGLFCYPVLMAADILIVEAEFVPVGQDQIQHIEMTQDMAEYFNRAFKSEVLKRPEACLSANPKIVGIDGEKMSKSYGNTIDLFAPAKKSRKRMMAITTDSTPVEAPKDPERCYVMSFMRLFASDDEVKQWEERYRQGPMGYGEAKVRLVELFEQEIGPARERYEKLLQDTAYLEDVLLEGEKKARKVVEPLMERVRQASGIC